jgi:hypothetical protein
MELWEQIKISNESKYCLNDATHPGNLCLYTDEIKLSANRKHFGRYGHKFN